MYSNKIETNEWIGEEAIAQWMLDTKIALDEVSESELSRVVKLLLSTLEPIEQDILEQRLEQRDKVLLFLKKIDVLISELLEHNDDNFEQTIDYLTTNSPESLWFICQAIATIDAEFDKFLEQ